MYTKLSGKIGEIIPKKEKYEKFKTEPEPMAVVVQL